MIGKIWKNIENTAINNPNRAIGKAYWFGASVAFLGAQFGLHLDSLIKRGERVLFKERIEKGELKFYDIEKCSDTSIKLHPIKIIKVRFDVDDIVFINYSFSKNSSFVILLNLFLNFNFSIL